MQSYLTNQHKFSDVILSMSISWIRMTREIQKRVIKLTGHKDPLANSKIFQMRIHFLLVVKPCLNPIYVSYLNFQIKAKKIVTKTQTNYHLSLFREKSKMVRAKFWIKYYEFWAKLFSKKPYLKHYFFVTQIQIWNKIRIKMKRLILKLFNNNHKTIQKMQTAICKFKQYIWKSKFNMLSNLRNLHQTLRQRSKFQQI